MPRKAVSTPSTTPETLRADDVAGVQQGITVWFAVRAPTRPRSMASYLGELAGPDFDLEACRESARLGGMAAADYRAHWCCRFSPRADDSFAGVRLLKRLTGAGFNVLRYDAGAQMTSLSGVV